MGVNSFSWESIFSIYTCCQKNADKAEETEKTEIKETA